MARPVAIDLTENALRVLWPPNPDVQQGNFTSNADTRITPSRMRTLSQTRDISFSVPTITIGPISRRYLRGKIQISGTARVRIPLNSQTGQIQEYISGDIGKRAFSASLETVVNDKLTIAVGAQLTPDNLEEVFVKIGEGDWTGAAAKACNLTFRLNQEPRLFNIVDRIDFGISPDDDLCLFFVTGVCRQEVPIRSIGRLSTMLPSGFPRNAKLQVDISISLRLGLTEAGWAACATRLGGTTALRAAARTIANAATRAAVIAMSAEVAVPLVIVAASAGYLLGMAHLVNQAHITGANWGYLADYCVGYLNKIKYAHDGSPPRRRFSPMMRYGWDDAEKAIRATSVERVERTIITHFGSTFDRDLASMIGETAEAVEGFFTGTGRSYIQMNTVENIHSAVGNTIDTDHEISVVGCLVMARYLSHNMEMLSEYLATSQSGVGIRSLEY